MTAVELAIRASVGDAVRTFRTRFEFHGSAEMRCGNVKTAVDKSIKDQPMTTLAVAAAVGFVLGALWKS